MAKGLRRELRERRVKNGSYTVTPTGREPYELKSACEAFAAEIKGDHSKLVECYGLRLTVANLMDFYGEERQAVQNAVCKLVSQGHVYWTYDKADPIKVGGRAVKTIKLASVVRLG